MLRAIAGGALKIVREEMHYSAPGWNADRSTEDDATTLVSPISVAVRQQAGDLNGACRPVSYTLELTDASSEIRPDTGQCQADRRLRPGSCKSFLIRITVATTLVPTAVPTFLHFDRRGRDQLHQRLAHPLHRHARLQ